ncbi:MAG: butyrate kinase, partial [Bacteroidales bacterium]
MNKRLILAINPGSTSTKFGVFEEEKMLFDVTLRHSSDDLKNFKKITDQYAFRKDLVLKELKERAVDTGMIRAVVGRGGLVKPIESGIYRVNEAMKEDLRRGLMGEHASNLGGLIADDIASSLGNVKAYIVDPVVVDEMEPLARIAGHPEFKRLSIFHALNQKAIARTHARNEGKKYDELNLIVAHMGGGISVGAHRKGKVIDVNNALNGEGPFSPERSGGLPAGQLVDLCFSGRFTKEEIKSMITGKGGMVAYLGTNDFRDICSRADEGEPEAKLIRDAAAYQVSREIASLAAVLKGEVDAIILTGGMAYQTSHVDIIKERTGFLAPVYIYPGEDELKALAFNGLLALDGQIEVKDYSG